MWARHGPWLVKRNSKRPMLQARALASLATRSSEKHTMRNDTAFNVPPNRSGYASFDPLALRSSLSAYTHLYDPQNGRPPTPLLHCLQMRRRGRRQAPGAGQDGRRRCGRIKVPVAGVRMAGTAASALVADPAGDDTGRGSPRDWWVIGQRVRPCVTMAERDI